MNKHALHEMLPTARDSTRLDRWVDFTRDFIVVLYAIASAFSTFTQTDVSQIYWALVVIGAVIIYSLYLPYKRAALIKGDLGLVARARVLRTILVGLPLWLVLTIIFLYNPSLAASVPAYLANPSSTELNRVITLIVPGTILFVSTAFGVGLKPILNTAGYNEKESQHLLRYLKSRGLRDSLMVSFMVLFAVCNVVSGWSTREQAGVSLGYFGAAIVYILMLIIYGLFYPWYIPERYTSETRMVLEGLLFLVLVSSPANVIAGFVLSMVLLAILSIKTQHCEEVKIESILEQEKKDMEESLLYRISSLFSEHHKRFTRVYLGVLSMVAAATLVQVYLDVTRVWFSFTLFYGGLGLYFVIAVAWAFRLTAQDSKQKTAST